MKKWVSSGSVKLEDSVTQNKRGSATDVVHPEEVVRLHQDDDSLKDKVERSSSNSCCSGKYCSALKICIPCRPANRDKTALPSTDAGLFSYTSVSWLTKLMWKAYKTGLEATDLWDLQGPDKAQNSCQRLERLWEEEVNSSQKNKKKPELWRAVYRLIKTRIIVAMIISVIQNVLQFLGPSVLLKITLDYVNTPNDDTKYASLLVVAVFLVNIFRASTFNLNFIISTHGGIRAIGGVQALIYKKILKLRTGGENLSAQMVNISSNDMERLFEAAISVPFLTSVPVMFSLSAFYCIYMIGPWAILGLGIFILFYPIMGMIAKAQSQIRLETIKITDKRVTLMGEILSSIRLIKMYSWEDSFAKKIKEIRMDEMKKLKKGAFLSAISSTVTPSLSILGTIVTILGYTLAGESLSSAEAYTIFSVFNAMQFSIGVLPFAVRSIAEAKVSLSRVQKLIMMSEYSKERSGLIDNNLAVHIKGATFAWEEREIDLKKRSPKKSDAVKANKESKKKDTKSNGSINNGNITQHAETEKDQDENAVKYIETLFNLSLSVEKGKLIGICGSVGAGKSSLLSAICGDMIIQHGELQVNGQLAIATQIPWIYNDSFQENIIVGHTLDKEKYKEVLEVCSLKSDIDLLPDGDKTEIGEKGVNLSGGQKQRVNLGRAVYSDRDIYLLDDPLSAVDTKVAKHIFNNCIKGTLKDKTVFLVSHSTHYLEKCDEIIVFDMGKICERGSHSELMSKEGVYYEMVSYDSARDNDNVDVDSNLKKFSRQKSSSGKDEDNQDVGKLIKEETKSKGGVRKEVYLKFLEVCGGWCLANILFFSLVIFTLARLFNSVWLQIWLDAGDGHSDERRMNETLSSTLSDDELNGSISDHHMLWMFQLVYGLSFIVIVFTGIIKSVVISFRVLAGSSKLHTMMFTSILSSPLSFFDTTPSGRILNRFSRDLDELDVRIPFFMEFVLQGMLLLLAQLVMVCYIYPWFIIPLVIIAVIFVIVDFFLNVGVRELKRLDNTLKSPVLQHIASSISGLTIIRTYEKEQLFLNRFYKHLNKHSVAMLVFRLSNRWFTFRMDLLAILVTVAITVICVFTKGTVSTAIAGLALSSINGICVFIPFLMRMKSEFQSRITSLERILEYAQDLPSEAARNTTTDLAVEEWPLNGAIEIDNVKLRYRSELPLVLHGISASIESGQKIGIVGRTGAGKSSLISTLLRLVELDSGKVIVDNVDISTVGLHTLRSAISVIPQDPVLFQGTMRYNLDPFDEHSDDKLWEALERSHLKEVVQKLQHGLLAKVEAAGENFSVGEKQLICLTRALLRNTKILLLDEATASVDMETDHLIQMAIKNAFGSCTVLTIAHRLNTVASYDRIMVLDAGKVIEFDSPEKLMMIKTSVFYEMMQAMGVTSVEQMKELTQKSY